MTAVELENNTPTFRMDERLIAGRYRLHHRIGLGRLGEIFAASDESSADSSIGYQLAIQIIPENIVRNNKLFNKLNVGYSTLRAAAHPNIVRYLNFGRHGQRGFLIMEFLDGASLRVVLDSAETLPPDEAKPVIRSAGEALGFLHAQDTVHGNLTTANVFITDELKVRLLDVLPIGADQAVIRGGTTSSAFSRCTVRDDVFGLACLAYEMLAGKHPFNYSPPAEASQAGLEPERIETLNDSDWDALRRALSLDQEQRTASVSDFMRDFGVSSAERLRPVAVRPARQEFSGYPAAANAPVVAAPAEPARISEPVVSIAAANPDVTRVEAAQRSRPGKSSSSPRRTVLLGILLATLGAWFYYGQSAEQVAALIDLTNERVVAGFHDIRGRAARTTASVPARPVATDRVAPAGASPATSTTDDATPVNPGDIGREIVASADLMPEDSAQAAEDTPPAAPADAENSARDQAQTLVTDAALAEAVVDQVETGHWLAFAEPVISVTERDGAARIAVPKTGYTESPLVWWTSEHSAKADKDFIGVNEQLLSAATLDDGNTLLVPLVNDSLPEPPESFFVSLGFRDPQRGRIERIATVRVDILDDD